MKKKLLGFGENINPPNVNGLILTNLGILFSFLISVKKAAAKSGVFACQKEIGRTWT